MKEFDLEIDGAQRARDDSGRDDVVLVGFRPVVMSLESYAAFMKDHGFLVRVRVVDPGGDKKA